MKKMPNRRALLDMGIKNSAGRSRMSPYGAAADFFFYESVVLPAHVQFVR